MFDNMSHGTEKEKDTVFNNVVAALRTALETYFEHTKGGL